MAPRWNALQEEDQGLTSTPDVCSSHAATTINNENKLTSGCGGRKLWEEGQHDSWTTEKCISTQFVISSLWNGFRHMWLLELDHNHEILVKWSSLAK